MTEIIAEIGINHGGSLSLAKQMMLAASEAGVRTVKFQTHIPEEMASDRMPPEILKNIQSAMLTEAQEADLCFCVQDEGMEYLSTPFHPKAVERLERLNVRRYKIGSGEVSNLPLLTAVRNTGKPILMSTGLCTPEQLDEAVSYLEGRDLTLLHCVSIYPTPLHLTDLGALYRLQHRYPQCRIGFSDHSKGIAASLIAMGMGAEVIERHFRLERQECPDAAVSIDPIQLAALCTTRKERGTRVSHETLSWALHGVVAARDIEAGEHFDGSNLTTCRPLSPNQVPASEFFKLLGQTSLFTLKAGAEVRL